MEEYAVVFTANATHALRLVADNFAFNERGSSETRFSTTPYEKAKITSTDLVLGPIFAYLRDSHNSVVGMREIVKDKVDEVVCADACENLLVKTECSLFAMTAMSNFCGRKMVDLSRCSFVGFHITAASQRDAIDRLRPRGFAGGTVKQILSDEFYSVLRDNIEERLEHGTLNYYAICALTKGFDDLKRYGMRRDIFLKLHIISFTAGTLSFDLPFHCSAKALSCNTKNANIFLYRNLLHVPMHSKFTYQHHIL
ncbi:unnamed protein product [Haemonchus placei]|uniref:UmuC domain-containing protein n=1 Tax=Haemonchus placei TaxID=6290 RepID=A0A0N4VU97_HAEPC|nr:unnamed protein product [Haemonchus placei]